MYVLKTSSINTTNQLFQLLTCTYFRQISEILQTTSLSSIWSFLSNPAFGQLMMFRYSTVQYSIVQYSTGQLMMFRIALVAAGFFVGFPLLALKGPLGAELIAG